MTKGSILLCGTFFLVCLLGCAQTKDCPTWNPSKSKYEGIIDGARQELMVKAGLQASENNFGQEQMNDFLNAYIRMAIGLLVPSAMMLLLLILAGLPIGITFGCCEKRCFRNHEAPETTCKPCSAFAIWLVLFIGLAVIIGLGQLSYTGFADGLTLTATQASNSMDYTACNINNVATKTGALGRTLEGVVNQGEARILVKVDGIDTEIKTLNSVVQTVVGNADVSLMSINASFKDLGFEGDIALPVNDFKGAAESLASKSDEYEKMLDDIRSTTKDSVDEINKQIIDTTSSLESQIKGVEKQIRDQQERLFINGSIDIPEIPVVVQEEKKGQTINEATNIATAALQDGILLIYLPTFASGPYLLIGGILMIAFFVSGRDAREEGNEPMCCPKAALCLSKAGCSFLWLSLILVLVVSIAFVLTSEVFHDTCGMLAHPYEVMKEVNKQTNNKYFNELTQQINNALPEGAGTVTITTLYAGVQQCFEGPSYNGDPIVSTLGIDSSNLVTTLVGNITLPVVDTSELTSSFDDAKTQVSDAKGQIEDFKISEEAKTDADSSCQTCTNFNSTFSHFSSYGIDSLEEAGDACNAICKFDPIESCNFNGTVIIGRNITVEGDEIVVQGGCPMACTEITRIKAPPQYLAMVVNNSLVKICEDCVTKACKLGPTIRDVNADLGDMQTNLSLLEEQIDTSKAKLIETVDSIKPITDDIITDANMEVGQYANRLSCAFVGEVIDEVVVSMCERGMLSFQAFALTTVGACAVGILLIVATIVLNMCAGLRTVDERDSRFQTESRTTEMITFQSSGRSNSYQIPAPVPVMEENIQEDFYNGNADFQKDTY